MRCVLLSALILLACSLSRAGGHNNGVRKAKMQFAAGYKRVFEEYTQALSQRYPDIRIEGENYLPLPIYRHIASFLSILKLFLIGLVIVGKEPFTLFGMEPPRLWTWSQENKIYACMMVFFFSNMLENQCLSTGAFEITLNDVPVWSKLESDFHNITLNPELQFLPSLRCDSPLVVVRRRFMKVCAESSFATGTGWIPRPLLADTHPPERLRPPLQWPFITTEIPHAVQ
ncbi:hypothetical protein KOW79_005910 [Hemibagrus wyckioides]|uniref:Selenoprotein T n=1 Tax=Hemibagrus wyckioides TaxID=337641 RepID=A0A9D3SSB6_9TELE|nr:hypothetical protein KOW79_005910 [Hemibagrus wyckioides]